MLTGVEVGIILCQDYKISSAKVNAILFANVVEDWDRNRARPAVGGGFPFPALSIAGRVHIPTMADVSRRPPIIPDGRISRVRFETLAFLPSAFPKFGEV